jgi:hypothetical protein
LHDAIAAERQGTPAVAVMTTNFVTAAELMGRILGIPGYQFAVIKHPVSSATDAGLQARARTTIEAINSIVLAQSSDHDLE